MKKSYLLDTHIAIWYLINPENISPKVKNILEDTENELILSSVNFWEISIKYQSKKLFLNSKTPEDLYQYFSQNLFTIIPLKAEETSTLYQLNFDYHKDPFDRMLIWQALKNDFTFITDDDHIKKYDLIGLKTIW